MKNQTYLEIDRIVPSVGRIRRSVGRDRRVLRRANHIIDSLIEIGEVDALRLVQKGDMSIKELIAIDLGKKFIRRPGRRPSTTVYLIRGALTGLHKIGVAGNVQQRITELQAASPDTLMLVGTVRGGRALERELHTRFANCRLHGEWFRFDAEHLESLRQFGFGTVSGEVVETSGPLRAIETPST